MRGCATLLRVSWFQFLFVAESLNGLIKRAFELSLFFQVLNLAPVIWRYLIFNMMMIP